MSERTQSELHAAGTGPVTPRPATRLRSLDLLRCAAILLVIGFHWASIGNPDRTSLALRFFHRFGWSGVDLFFVLSGFLVGGLVLREYQRFGRFSAGSFLIRRGLKIYPAFYAMLAMSVATAALMGRPATFAQVWHEALFVQNYLSPLWPHTWSLAVEEHFYLLLSLVSFLWLTVGHRALRLRHLLALYGLVSVGALACRLAHVGANWQTPYHYSHTRLDALLLGVVLTYLYHFHHERTGQAVRRCRLPLLAVAAACVSIPFLYPQGTWVLSTVGLTVLPWGFAALMMVLVYSREAHWAPLKLLSDLACRLGENSYSIYLWHIPMLYFSRHALRMLTGVEPTMGAWLGTYLALTLVGGIALARLIEWPVLRLRDRLFPSRSGTLTA